MSLTMSQTELLPFAHIGRMDLDDILRQLTGYLNTFRNHITENSNFYNGNTKKAEAEIILNQVDARWQVMDGGGEYLEAEISDLVLRLLDLLPESQYKELFLCVRFCIVRHLYGTIFDCESYIEEIETEYGLLEKLKRLTRHIDSENEWQINQWTFHQWHDGEFVGVSTDMVENITNALDIVQLLLKEEIPILLSINLSLDISALRQALVRLRNTKSLLERAAGMERFGGTFEKIGGLYDGQSLDLLHKYLRKIQDKVEERSLELNLAVAEAETILAENRTSDKRTYLDLARSILDIPPLMSEDDIWHDAIFSIARICYILSIVVTLEWGILPGIQRFAPNSLLAEELSNLITLVKREDQKAIAELLPTLHVGAFRTTVSDPENIENVLSLLALIAALLWRIAPVLWTVDNLSNNLAVKQALEGLQRELDCKVDQVESVFGLSKLGLAW